MRRFFSDLAQEGEVPLISGCSLLSLAPTPASVAPLSIRRLQQIHAFKRWAHDIPRQSGIFWKENKATMPCSDNAPGEMNSKIAWVSILELGSRFNHLRKSNVFLLPLIWHFIGTSIYVFYFQSYHLNFKISQAIKHKHLHDSHFIYEHLLGQGSQWCWKRLLS